MVGQLLYVSPSHLLRSIVADFARDFDTLGQQGIVVMYDEGDTCADGFSRAKISLVFHCNPNVSVQLTSVVGIGQYCHWVAHFESKYGCPM